MPRKTIVAVSVFLAVLAVSCDGDNPVSRYGEEMIGVYERGKTAGREINLKNIQDAVRAYRAANGEYPEGLEDIEEILGFEVDAEMYDYNPATGEVKPKGIR